MYIYIYIYICMSAPKAGRHSTICLFSPNASVQWQPDGVTNPHQQVVPRSRIPRSTCHFSYSVLPF